MNLPGPYQRLAVHHQAQGDGCIAVVFRSRPLYYTLPQLGDVAGAEKERAQRGGQWLRHTPAWHASVWDEVRASANGALRRRIRILITDGAQPDPEDNAGV